MSKLERFISPCRRPVAAAHLSIAEAKSKNWNQFFDLNFRLGFSAIELHWLIWVYSNMVDRCIFDNRCFNNLCPTWHKLNGWRWNHAPPSCPLLRRSLQSSDFNRSKISDRKHSISRFPAQQNAMHLRVMLAGLHVSANSLHSSL